jgi:hypothetical protein
MAGEDLSVSETVLTQDIDTTSGNDVITTAISNAIAVGLEISATGIPAGTTIVAIAPSATPGFYDLTLSADATATATVSADFKTIAGKISLWQHEIGYDEVKGQNVNAIYSMFETNDLGLVTGGPSQPSPVGENYWLHLERLEPDFLQTGEMELYITGRPYAQSEDQTTGPYVFNPDTNKIDLREQRRELRLKFVSNTLNGNYQLGTLLLSVNLGDVRGY